MFSKAFKNMLNKTSMHNVPQPQNSVRVRSMSQKYEVLQYNEALLKTLMLKSKFNRVFIVYPPFFLLEVGVDGWGWGGVEIPTRVSIFRGRLVGKRG